MPFVPIKRALLSVSNKEGIVPFAQALQALDISIISTGGTADLLRQHQIKVTDASEVTGFPELMDGRVKTLHPNIHAAILGKRDAHAEAASEHGINWIDLVVVNLYPFAQVIKDPKTSFEKAIENIDIGGPTMIRAAAKNMAWVTVVTDPLDYDAVLTHLREQQGLNQTQRSVLAQKAFAHTAQYDALIADYLAVKDEQIFADQLSLSLNKACDLRYGENPHQQAAAYRMDNAGTGLLDAHIHQGKALSYNNLQDADAALACVQQFKEAACVIVKHCNPCGVALGDNICDAFVNAQEADKLSAFGGIIALNRPCDLDTAQRITDSFFELVLAPSFSEEALQQLSKKSALRVLSLQLQPAQAALTYHAIQGAMLVQTNADQKMDVQIVTQKAPTDQNITDLLFAWRVVAQVKSNAIVIAGQDKSLGIGVGQVSRVDAVEQALHKAGALAKGAVMASDAFFPFRDSIDLLAKAGISAIIQPGGSMRDKEVIEACNEHGIAMVFTGQRCFKH